MNRNLRLLLYFILFFSSISDAQTLSQYRPGRNERVYVEALKDSVHLKVFIPREAELAPERKFPVIYLFDLQNRINYLYNLQTIDYLSSFGNMPAAVLVAVDFPGAVRTRWTLPNNGNGKADSLLAFLFGAYRKQLEKTCKLADYNVLIGHSRTAMLSSYALAAFPGQVNAVIASSNSFFDFDNPAQQALFENYIVQKEKQPGQPQFFYFSSGSKENGDPHDSSVTKLNNYMSAKEFPVNFHWQHYRENTMHITVPGMTTGRALNDLFSPCTRVIQQCFTIVNKQVQTDSVPWVDYLGIYKDASSYLGLDLQPDLSFYNSIASAYINDYNNQFKENRFTLATAVLKQGIAAYPAYPGFYSSLAGIKLEQGDKLAARKLVLQAQASVKALRYCNPELLKEEKASINELFLLVK